MSKTCSACGAQRAADTDFCTECGAPTPAAPITGSGEIIPKKGTDEIVRAGYFFWSMLLYSIPVVGFTVCLISAVAAKNENKKHFAKAVLVWYIVGLVLAVIACLLIGLFGSSVISYLKTTIEGQFAVLSEILSQLPSFCG